VSPSEWDAPRRRLVPIYVGCPACVPVGIADAREGDVPTCPRCGN